MTLDEHTARCTALAQVMEATPVSDLLRGRRYAITRSVCEGSGMKAHVYTREMVERISAAWCAGSSTIVIASELGLANAKALSVALPHMRRRYPDIALPKRRGSG